MEKDYIENETGVMKNGVRDGTFTVDHRSGGDPLVRVYDDGVLISANGKPDSSDGKLADIRGILCPEDYKDYLYW